MTIQHAIEKAIEGGYLKTQVGSLSYIDPEHYYRNREAHFRGNAVNEPFSIHIDSLMVDPQFWQCLGKSVGWDDYADFCSNCKKYGSKTFDCPMQHCTCPANAWIYHWHRLIDHLSEDNDLTSFFETLE